MKKWTRRAFIGAGTMAGGGFLLGVAGFTFAPGRHTMLRDIERVLPGERLSITLDTLTIDHHRYYVPPLARPRVITLCGYSLMNGSSWSTYG